MRKAFSSVLAAFLLAYILLYVGIELAKGFGVIVPPGVSFNLATGAVTAVTPHTAAAAAGIRVGDRADFIRGGWQLHLSLDRLYVAAGQATRFPLIRNGRPITAVLIGPKPVLPPDAWSYFVSVATLLLYSGLGALLYFMRGNTASLALFAFACGEAIQVDNLAPLAISTPAWMPLAMLLGTIGPYLGQYGLLYFGVLFSNRSSAAWAFGRYTIGPLVVILSAIYYFHFYAYTVLPVKFNVFLLVSILNWLVFAAAAAAITARVSSDPDSRRLRWVAVGIWAQALVFGIFYIDQNVRVATLGGTPFITYLFGWFAPAPLCVAYVLLRTRVIDVRIIGARTIAYAALTAIPIGLFSIVDWFFARELADERLATFAEFAVAVLFGVWLNSLHKRIDRFIERVVFARRHHAFQRVRHAIHALSGAERSGTPISMLCEEAAGALEIASAAVFLERSGGTYERAFAHGWDKGATELQADDPLVLFARSRGHAVRLSEVAPSPSLVPSGDAAPEIAIPIRMQQNTIGVALYGKHQSGEHLDGDEEELLSELAHAAGAALHRLQTVERLHELEAELRIATL